MGLVRGEHTLWLMRYVFRADASNEIGAGHVMRSLALAEEVIARGFEAIFVGRIENLDWVTQKIGRLGFSLLIENELNFRSNPDLDILILDSYETATDNPFISKIGWNKIVVIADDLTPSYECDFIVHPGLEGAWLGKSSIPSVSGPDYLLIRKAIKKNPISFNTLGSPLKIIVTGGGSDPTKFCLAIASTLETFTEYFTAIFLADGRSSKIEDDRFTFLPIGSLLDEVLTDVDLVLSPASTSSFEFIAREIPTGIACAADNQQLNYKTLTRLRLAYPVGIYSINAGWEIDRQSIHHLISDSKLRQELHGRTIAFIDLQGARRVLDKINSLL